MKIKKIAALTAAMFVPGIAFATNGMNMEGYGPVATAMGGASMAYDNGTAAVMNNPATLALAPNGHRVDIAVGRLGPDVNSSMPAMAMTADSGGTAYYMPAIGWVKKQDKMAYGVAVFAQGGMGTEYSSSSFLANPTGAPTGQDVRSELGVGRLIFPFAYQVDSSISVGGSIDYVWAGLDLKMAAPVSQLAGMVTSGSGAIAGVGGLPGTNWARIDFSDSSDYTGKAQGRGFAGKLGVVYKASEGVSVGATYHSKTQLGDLETSNTGASLSAEGFGADTGRIRVIDFQWPETYGVGVAWQASPQVFVAADYKKINWSGVMDAFRMTYTSAGVGGEVSFAMPQKWEDQGVIQIGAAYRMNDALTLRAGFNQADNPIPDTYLNPLFPAIVETHYTFGAGYVVNKASSVDFALTLTPEAKGTTPGGVVVTHKQTNMQFMYSYRY